MKNLLRLFGLLIYVLTSSVFVANAQSVSQYNNGDDDYKVVPKSSTEVLNNYRYRVDMYDDITRYYILYDDEIYGYNPEGKLVLMGFREASKQQNTGYLFTFTILSTQKTYGVDKYGHAWYYGSNSREIVASVNRREALQLFGKQ